MAITTKGDGGLDLSIKDFWLIIHFKEGDPGKEFEILHQSKLVENSWETLERGVSVSIMCGNCRSQGTVVHVSDDHEYLKKNFESIKEEFLEEYYNQNDIKPPERYLISKMNSYYITKTEVIKIADKETQTDGDDEFLELQGKYEALKYKYDNLQETLHTLRDEMQDILNKVDNHVNRRKRAYRSPTPSVSSRENSKSPKTRNTTKTDKPVQGRSILGTLGNQTNRSVDEDDNSSVVQIGTGKTKVPRSIYESINWHYYTNATRKLLMALFDRNTLATHSLTGKPSPAFLGTDKQAKMRLDPVKITDVVETVSKNCGVSQSQVRSAITTKCADENKMYRKRLEKENENSYGESKPKKTKYN